MKVLNKSYIVPNGDNTRHASPDATAIQFDWSDGESQIFSFDDLLPDIRECAMRHGISQKLGDVAGKGDLTIADKRTLVQGVWDAISGDQGIWVKRGEAGEPKGDLLAALIRVNEERNKGPLSDEQRQKVVALVGGLDNDGRKRYAKDDRVAAALKTIRAERAAEAAKAARKKAKQAGDESELDLYVA